MSTNPYHYSFNLFTVGRVQNQRSSTCHTFPSSHKNSIKTCAFHCETCDREFNTKQQFDSHIAEHETCNRDGCKFTAHPKVVANHIRMQHDSGLYKRIGELKNPEAINAWIAERKRKYPTLKNVEIKKQIELQKEKRGERIKPDNPRFNPYFRTKKPQKRKPRKGPKISAILDMEESKNKDGLLLKFPGVGSMDQPKEDNLEEGQITDLSDDEYINSPNKPILNKSLNLLMVSYNSDDDSDDEPPEEIKNKKSLEELQTEKPNEVKIMTPPEDIVQDKLLLKTPLAGTQIKKIINENSKKQNTVKEHIINKRTNKTAQRMTGPSKPVKISKRRPTLLEKLLEKEIVHERNVILQCIRYIIENNFFDPFQLKNE